MSLVARYAARRILMLIPTLLGVLLITLFVPRLIPGDAVSMILGTESVISPERANEMRRLLGLERPIHVQFIEYVAGLARGDFGRSLRTGAPIGPLLLERFSISFALTLYATVIAIAISVPIGVMVSSSRSVWLGLVVRIASLIGLSVPQFWMGTLLLIGATFYFPGVFPTVGAPRIGDGVVAWLQGSLLPAFALSVTMAAVLVRMIRSSMLEVLSQDYVRTAWAKGLTRRVVFFSHALRNAFIPVVTEIGLQFGLILGGAILVETVFTYPGFGLLVMRAIEQRDYPILQGALLLSALLFSLINLAVDMAYALLDPRISYE